MFLDEALVTVNGGNGGDGLVSWRREKFISHGGPYGGDGGNGGNVIFIADNNTDTLAAFAERKVFHAEGGENGKTARMAGRTGEDLVLKVPSGTVISKVDGSRGTGSQPVQRGQDRPTAPKTAAHTTILADLAKEGDIIEVARGGRGGYGNAHFASSIRQAPDFAEKGEPGETRKLKLELKLVADIGIIGFPSTGKSTLISVISNSKPKIAEYEFTTLIPNLGVVTVHDRQFVVCDVPGLIEGASDGRGLGDKFLRHIERCGALVHLLDVNREDIVRDYRTIRTELERYSPALSQKQDLVVLNKIDLIQNDASLFVEELDKEGIEVFAVISAVTKYGIAVFLNKLLSVVLEQRKQSTINNQQSTVPVLRPQTESGKTGAFRIEEKPKGTFVVTGKRIKQVAVMTDWSSSGGKARFRDIVQRIGLRGALERAGATEESIVFVEGVDVSGEW
jgi:GTPase